MDCLRTADHKLKTTVSGPYFGISFTLTSVFIQVGNHGSNRTKETMKKKVSVLS